MHPRPGGRTISNAAVASATDSSISPSPPSLLGCPLPGRKRKSIGAAMGYIPGRKQIFFEREERLSGFSEGTITRPANLRVRSAPSGAEAGVPEAKPPAKSTKSLPLPPRGKSALRARVGGVGQKVHARSGRAGDGRARTPLPVPQTAG